MTVNSLYPAYLEINYHSSFAPHVMTIPLISWEPSVDIAGELGTWGGTPVQASDGVQTLVDLLLPFFPSTVEFDYFFVHTYASPTADPVVAAGATLTGAGSAGTPGWSKATQATFTFKTAAGGLSKSVLLDNATGNNFNPLNFASLTGDALTYVNWYLSDDSFIAGRDNARPSFFLKISYDLNDALRKQYHMD